MSDKDRWSAVVKFIGMNRNRTSLRVQSDKPELEGFTFNVGLEQPVCSQVLDTDLSGYAYGVLEIQGKPRALAIPDTNGGTAYGINVVKFTPMTADEYFEECGISEMSVEDALAGLAQNARPAELRGLTPVAQKANAGVSALDRAMTRAGYGAAAQALLS